MLDESAVHILGGGIGGTVGAVLTCPLEVIKVRLQSSQGISIRYSSGASSSETTPPPPPQQQSTKSHHQPKSGVGHGACTTTTATSLRNIVSSHDHNPRPKSLHHHNYHRTTAIEWEPMQIAHNMSSHARFPSPTSDHHPHPYSSTHVASTIGEVPPSAADARHTGIRRSVLIRSLMDIAKFEGFRALFKGLIPTLFGVLPSRGVYFFAYHEGQLFFQPYFPEGSSSVYLCSAGMASITASSLTNPIWFIKTRLQLDCRPSQPPITVLQVIRSTLKQDGIRGFYRGVSASYVGSLETALNFVVYENVKSRLLLWDRQRQHRQQATLALATCGPTTATTMDSTDLRGSRGGSKLNTSSDMVLCMLASACSKAIAITAFYPHEVARTRLREASGKYRGFFGTLYKVAREDGAGGLYRGMGTHYIRQVPNSCIMIGTYEVVVFLLHSWGLVKV